MMLDFELSADLSLLQETARAFAAEQLRPRERTAESARGVDAAVRRLYDEIGLARLELSESLGGAGLGALAGVLVREELAAADAGAALGLDPLGAALYGLRELGGEEALRRFAAPLLDRAGARALLVFDGTPRIRIEGGLAHGELPWLPADRVDLLVVLERERAYVLRDGLVCEPVRGAGLRAAGASALRIEAAPVLGEWVSTPGARRALAGARLHVAALLVGVMRQAAEFSRQYARERVAFGRPIAHHQALAFLIVDMAAAVDAARLLVWEAAWRFDRGLPAEEACASAFVECVEASLFVAPNALQLLGGHGFMQDYPVEKYLRDARALGLLLGGVDAAREDAGRDLLRVFGGVTLGGDDPQAEPKTAEA
jgi:alkylation response protein AidB-like acyl-CoA dehydrogenase